jgi:hypothetical protein
LPIEAGANVWGEEIYFSVAPRVGHAEDAREVVEMGALAYWPPGRAFCVFFGPTPASRGDEIRAASSVNVFGRVEGDPKILRGIHDGARIRVDKAKD